METVIVYIRKNIVIEVKLINSKAQPQAKEP